MAQQPDLVIDDLRLASGSRNTTIHQDIQAKLQVFCNGTHLSLVIEVRDNQVETNPGNYFTDHVEVFFALPSRAFPKNFEHSLHPNYIYAEPHLSRGANPGKEAHRFFSTYAEFAQELELEDFLQGHDYPSPQSIQLDSLDLPSPNQLSKVRLDYGLVRLGLFPDERAPVLYHQDHYELLESVLDIDMGNISSGIIYTVDPLDSGYVINAQISPEALGFIQIPRMEEVYLAVDVIDTDLRQKRGATVVTSSPMLDPISRKRSYNRIKLIEPLRTNFSPVPDRIFNLTGYQPTCVYSEEGWVPVAADVDALAFKESSVSQYLTEVRFMQRPMEYLQEMDKEHLLSIEKLSFPLEYVNALGLEQEHLVINNQMFTAQHMIQSLSPLDNGAFHEVFQFPDGQHGLILINNHVLNPYGWGECGTCLDERISIYRLERETHRQLLKIEQGPGSPAYCTIGEQHFDGFRITKVNWVRKGEIMVLQLDHQDRPEKKRLKIQWDASGEDLEVEVLP